MVCAIGARNVCARSCARVCLCVSHVVQLRTLRAWCAARVPPRRTRASNVLEHMFEARCASLNRANSIVDLCARDADRAARRTRNVEENGKHGSNAHRYGPGAMFTRFAVNLCVRKVIREIRLTDDESVRVEVV